MEAQNLCKCGRSLGRTGNQLSVSLIVKNIRKFWWNRMLNFSCRQSSRDRTWPIWGLTKGYLLCLQLLCHNCTFNTSVHREVARRGRQILLFALCIFPLYNCSTNYVLQTKYTRGRRSHGSVAAQKTKKKKCLKYIASTETGRRGFPFDPFFLFLPLGRTNLYPCWDDCFCCDIFAWSCPSPLTTSHPHENNRSTFVPNVFVQCSTHTYEVEE